MDIVNQVKEDFKTTNVLIPLSFSWICCKNDTLREKISTNWNKKKSFPFQLNHGINKVINEVLTRYNIKLFFWDFVLIGFCK